MFKKMLLLLLKLLIPLSKLTLQSQLFHLKKGDTGQRFQTDKEIFFFFLTSVSIAKVLYKYIILMGDKKTTN